MVRRVRVVVMAASPAGIITPVRVIASPVRIPPIGVVAVIRPAETGVCPGIGIVTPTEIPVVVKTCAPSEAHYAGRTPCAEHRSNVFGFDPHFVAHDDDVVNGRVVGRNELVGAVVTKVEIARRHLIGRGAESPQTTGIGAFVRVGQHALVGVVRCVVCGFGLPGLYFGATGFRFGLASFGYRLFFLGDAGDIVFRVHVVDVVGAGLVECRRTACREERHEQSTYFEISVFHRVSELLCGYIFNENRTGFIADESLSHKSSNKIGKYIERVKIEIRIFFCSENAFFAKNSYICTPNYRPKGW